MSFHDSTSSDKIVIINISEGDIHVIILHINIMIRKEQENKLFLLVFFSNFTRILTSSSHFPVAPRTRRISAWSSLGALLETEFRPENEMIWK